MATFLIGDIQGCYDPLQRLLEKINFDPASDSLWCPGDLVNRGGDSLQVLRLLEGMGDNFSMTLGNHDLYLLAENYRYPDGHSPNPEINAILQAPDRLKLLDWMQAPATGPLVRRAPDIDGSCRCHPPVDTGADTVLCGRSRTGAAIGKKQKIL